MGQTKNRGPIEEIVDFFAGGPSRQEIAAFRLSAASQEHLRDLLSKNSTGTLAHDEERELDKMMVLNEVVSRIRVRAQAGTANDATSSAASEA